MNDMPRVESNDLSQFAKVMRPLKERRRIAIDQGEVKCGLGRLVLTLVELIRQLLERQAIRRVESGSLTEGQIDRLGTTFMELSREIEMLKKDFGLKDEDLNVDLGPLGRLL